MELEQIIRQKVIRETKTELDVSVKEMLGKVEILQDICTHPNVTKISKSNTGNYDPHGDKYWKECRCPDCDKYWREDDETQH